MRLEIAKCVHCGKEIVLNFDEKARYEGLIYSQEGEDEYAISGLCEYCFDEITKPSEDEEENKYEYSRRVISTTT